MTKLLLEDCQAPGENNQSPQRNKMIPGCHRLDGSKEIGCKWTQNFWDNGNILYLDCSVG